jgi:hypothetical protein
MCHPAVVAALLGTLLTGCASEDGLAPLAGLLQNETGWNEPALRTAEANDTADSSDVRANLREAALGAAFEGLLAQPEFSAVLEATGVTPDQAEVVLSGLGGEIFDRPVLRDLAMQRIAELAADTLLDVPLVESLADESGLEPDQVEQMAQALILPDQTVREVFLTLVQEELAGLILGAN